jgi:hypothetical protein
MFKVYEIIQMTPAFLIFLLVMYFGSLAIMAIIAFRVGLEIGKQKRTEG